MKQTSNPYEILGLDVTASHSNIKKHYLKLAKKYHPDVCAVSGYFSEKFSQINQAYRILSNPNLRAEFDKGHIDINGKKITNKSTVSKQTQSVSRTIIATSLSKKNHFQINLSFKLAALGGEIKVKLESLNKNFVLKIPPASDSQTVLKIPKIIKKGFFRKDQDIFIHLNIASHPTIRRDQLDLYIDVPISMAELFSETKIKVPLLKSFIQVKLPKINKPYSQIRLKDKGLKKGSQVGHVFLNLSLQLPNKSDQSLKTFLSDWEEKNPYLKR